MRRLCLLTLSLVPFALISPSLLAQSPPIQCCLQLNSSSMLPTLRPGANISFIRYDGPGTLNRGDIIVFILTTNSSTDVKRLVALPGEQIQMRAGALYINGQAVRRDRIDDFQLPEGTRVKQWRETLPNGVSFNTIDIVENGFYSNTSIYTTPPNSFFVLGDNRNNSTDSRVLTQVGYIPFNNILGHALAQ
jgi:signal peptidase I